MVEEEMKNHLRKRPQSSHAKSQSQNQIQNNLGHNNNSKTIRQPHQDGQAGRKIIKKKISLLPRKKDLISQNNNPALHNNCVNNNSNISKNLIGNINNLKNYHTVSSGFENNKTKNKIGAAGKEINGNIIPNSNINNNMNFNLEGYLKKNNEIKENI